MLVRRRRPADKLGETLAPLLANVRWGARFGFGSGCVYSLFQLGARLVSGPEYFTKHNVTAQEIIPIYIIGLTLAGVVLGITRPLSRWLVGTMVLGVIAVTPFMIAVFEAEYGPVIRWNGTVWFDTIACGVLVGTLTGFELWWDGPHAGAPPKGRPDDKPSRKLFRHWKP